ncbi:MAG: SMC family ATPase, partial [Anaerolineales bacterium]|nr:SMC family ATPase [Anaerolineales bacterium]
TFANSAYLVQGQADEFTGKRPAERKQVLADILGLQEWEKYEERAKQKIKAVDVQLSGLDAVLREIEAELARRPDYERELNAVQARLIEASERLRQAEADWARIEAARQALVAVQRQIDDLARRLRDAEREIAALDADLQAAQSQADTAGLARAIAQTESRLRELNEREAERDQMLAARQVNAELSGQLKGQNESAQQEAEALKKRLAAAEADAQQARRRVLEAGQAEAEKLRRRVANLETATEALCPTCGQPLSEAQRQQLLADLAAEIDARQAQAQAEAAEIDHNRVQAQEALTAEVEARRSVYRQNQAQLKTLGDEQSRLDRDIQAFAGQLKEKPGLTERLGELKTALEQAGAAQDRIAGLLARRARWTQSSDADRQARQTLEAEAAGQRAVLRDADARQRALDQLRQEDTLAKARLGAAEQKLRALDGLAEQREAKRAERGRAAEARGLYDELREAFGKKGAPAMIIEAAVPEIEAAANRLLGRITDGRMTLRFKMQRETQAGDVRETLDIEIGDELGTRAYEMYSGGEAFRVNFAVRIALSQLLARRAGTQLHTLIIDEGFGVLDAVGRERLVEAINAIQDDFERILVVTHIDELKDAFPARIEITKTPAGSEITVG